ncbi:hypothetical protein JW890_00875 [candidate division WOR-3 bacterium]|nr:hypothetical protein [candidate division WOR-3 bacterium]
MKKPVLIIIFSIVCISLSYPADFSGSWETTYGKMILEQNGDAVSGGYFFSGYCKIEGRIEPGGRFRFRYTEPSATGEGWFELSPDGMSFSGEWRQDGTENWYEWTGMRTSLRDSSAIWLVVFEAEWQESLDEGEYSFGEMLRAFFARLENVEVRQRFVHDRKDLINFCAETAILPGDVYILFATHGEKDGLVLRDGIARSDVIVSALAPCKNLRLVHFSSCNIMSGNTPDEIIKSRRDWKDGFVVSGYVQPVDWAGSAVFEFYYLNLIFECGMTPEEAAETAAYLFRFSGTSTVKGVEGLGFRWKTPM